jgi:hypothetical protein
VHTGIWWENVRERGPLEELGVDGKLIFEWNLNISNVRVWPGLIWLWIVKGGGLL